MLTPEEQIRYARHLSLPEVGRTGQERLKGARVLVVGLGGLGSPCATYLAAAGVGTLGLVEFDTVEASNLHRQPLHFHTDLGRSKLDSAIEKLKGLNPDVSLEPHAERLDAGNALRFVQGYDVVCDGTDNFDTRYLVNDACVLAGVPNVYASVYRFEGQLSVLGVRGGPCYRCLFPRPPGEGVAPSCAEGGVLGVLPGLVGTYQAAEALKWILGIGEPLVGRLLLVDVLGARADSIRIERDPACAVCGEHATITSPTLPEAACEVPEQTMLGVPEITPLDLAAALKGPIPPLLVDVREPFEIEIASIDPHVAIPMGQIVGRIAELDRHTEMVVICHTGIRSAQVTAFLLRQGYERVRSLAGGVARWAIEVDPEMPRY